MTDEDQTPLAAEVADQIEQLRAEVEASFQRGFEAGRQTQRVEDQLYLTQIDHYKKLVDMYHEEIQRLRAK